MKLSGSCGIFLGIVLGMCGTMPSEVRADAVSGSTGPGSYQPVTAGAAGVELDKIRNGDPLSEGSALIHGLTYVPDPSQKMRHHPPPTQAPLPQTPSPDNASLTDTSGVTQERLDNSSCSGLSAATVLEGANTPADQEQISEAVSKLDQWFPGWSSQLQQRHVTVVVTDHIQASAQSCVVGDGDQNIILVRRTEVASFPDPLIQMAGSLAHEAHHIADAPWTSDCLRQPSMSGCAEKLRRDESLCLERNAAVLSAAAADPLYRESSDALLSAANQQQFFADQVRNTNIPIHESFDPSSFAWIFSAYQAASNILAQDGYTFNTTTLISCQRKASSAGPSSDAVYTLVCLLPGGTQRLRFQFSLDETVN